MEITLIDNQPLNLIPCWQKHLVDPNRDGFTAMAMVREHIHVPQIRVGFKEFDVKSGSQRAYFEVNHFAYLVPRLASEFRQKNNFKLRLDIESLKSADYNMRPVKTSHFLVLRQDSDWERILWCFTADFISTNPNYGKTLLHNWRDWASDWSITLSLKLVISQKTGSYEGLPDQVAIYGKMRNDERFSDATIIVEDNVEIKCHKSVLAAHSTVFAAMFESRKKEGKRRRKEGVVDLSEMSQEGVRAMLEFLYVGKSETPNENPLVCLELLKAGGFYIIESLETCMKEILMKKDLDWFTPEAALRLVLHLEDMDCRNKGFDGRLKEKAIKVYKSNFAEVQKLPAYEELFNGKPQVLKKLFEFLSSN